VGRNTQRCCKTRRLFNNSRSIQILIRDDASWLLVLAFVICFWIFPLRLLLPLISILAVAFSQWPKAVPFQSAFIRSIRGKVLISVLILLLACFCQEQIAKSR
jgi:hypothetical protein